MNDFFSYTTMIGTSILLEDGVWVFSGYDLIEISFVTVFNCIAFGLDILRILNDRTWPCIIEDLEHQLATDTFGLIRR
jgi:hypothetical protein